MHRDLIVQFTRRELQVRHKGSRLGHLWGLISPLMMLGLYLFIFGLVFGGKFGVLENENFYDFAIALFLGLSLFNVIAESITIAPTLIVNQPNFVKKVVFPLEIIPLSKTLAALYYSLLSIAVCIALAPFGHGGLTLRVIEFPLLIIPLYMTALGITLTFSALGVFVRDINHITGFAATALMYASAIVYPPSRVPHSLWKFLRINPLPILVDQARSLILWNKDINLYELAYVYIISFFILIAGYFIFRRLRPYFSELL